MYNIIGNVNIYDLFYILFLFCGDIKLGKKN